eukprot:7214756-Ditylum_brightwellii.AAC.1
MFLVPDEGEINGLEYFGWAIGTHMDVLVTNKGQAPGNPALTESLQMESVGALSIMCFILWSCMFHNIKIQSNIWTHFCNNKTAVKRVQWCQLQTILNPTSTLAVDYDVQAQIKQVLNMMKEYCDLNKLIMHHMKGHQNGKDLVRGAQLNKMVDKLATLSQESLPWNSRDRTPLLYPSGEIMVLINNKVITRETA